jgi:hypothetical protein
MPHSDNALPYGFRIVGNTTNDRRLVDWSAAFRGCCECDERAAVDRESYLSAFTFGDDFRHHLTATASVRGFAGATWSPWLWFDIDRDDIEQATRDARRLAAGLVDRFKLDGDELLAFFSGAKGFHIGLPLSVCGSPGPSESFYMICRRFAEAVATRSTVAVDSGVYDRVRAFRAPNSRHPKTGSHKRRLTFGELMGLAPRRIVELATEPEPFDLPDPAPVADQAVHDWAAAVELVENEHRAAEMRRGTVGKAGARLNRATLDFIRDGATSGGTGNDSAAGVGRHRLLFSAAANLAEFGCSLELAEALLTESALDSGLSPSDVARQIRCGLNHKP